SAQIFWRTLQRGAGRLAASLVYEGRLRAKPGAFAPHSGAVGGAGGLDGVAAGAHGDNRPPSLHLADRRLYLVDPEPVFLVSALGLASGGALCPEGTMDRFTP